MAPSHGPKSVRWSDIDRNGDQVDGIHFQETINTQRDTTQGEDQSLNSVESHGYATADIQKEKNHTYTHEYDESTHTDAGRTNHPLDNEDMQSPEALDAAETVPEDLPDRQQTKSNSTEKNKQPKRTSPELANREAERPNMILERSEAFVTALLVWCVYFCTMSRSVTGGDSGEVLAAACSWGPAHPPGYRELEIRLCLWFALLLFISKSELHA
jgi:hypothetical protein